MERTRVDDKVSEMLGYSVQFWFQRGTKRFDSLQGAEKKHTVWVQKGFTNALWRWINTENSISPALTYKGSDF
jgi:hypothetical protein